MKHFRFLLPLLILALVLSGCREQVQEPYTASINGRDVNVYPASRQIVDGLDVYTYTIEENASGTNYTITYPNGSVFHWTETKNGGHGGWSEGFDSVRYLSGSTLVSILEINRPREKVGSPILGIPLMAMGVWHFVSPETVWYLNKGWIFKNAEPSDAYLFMTKIGGVIAVVAGLIVCIM